MNQQNTLKTITSLVLLLTVLVVQAWLGAEAEAARPSAGSVAAARSAESAPCAGPMGLSRADSEGGPLGQPSRADAGPLG